MKRHVYIDDGILEGKKQTNKSQALREYGKNGKIRNKDKIKINNFLLCFKDC